MINGILHLHITVIIIFLLMFLVKCILLFINNQSLLSKVRAKTKVAEMIIGTLILVTGGYLLYVTGNTETYMIGKIAIVMLAIPLGIIGIKKNNKVLTLMALFAFIYVYGVAETKSLKFKRDKFVFPAVPELEKENTVEDTAQKVMEQNEATALGNSKQIYSSLCIQCHGADGKLGAGGAKDLTKSTMKKEEMVHIITNGKGLMRAFKSDLSEFEIDALASYIEQLK